MIPLSTEMQALLAVNQRTPYVQVIVNYPDPNAEAAGNPYLIGSTLIIDGLLSVTIQRNEESSSDAMDFEVANGDTRYSPLRVN